jgi:uncharacterized protein (DUF983 family)
VSPAEEVAVMSQTFRHCPECGDDRLFEQHHADPGSCPDSPDGYCPEWACADCGAALLEGFVLYRAAPGQVAAVASRVA